MTTPPTIPLEIISDPICPWCYIGKTRLDRAQAARPNHPFIRIWRPFQLNPDMPPRGMDRTAYLERKFGGRENARQIYTAIEEAAAADGLEVRFDRIERTPNTLDAHRLIRWAGGVGVQDRVVDALFERYFLEGQDISDRELLCDLAEQAGLERDVIWRMLDDDVDLDTVRAEDAAARRAGVDGVPTFLVKGRYVVPGAQQTELWIRVIDELAARAAAETSGA